MADAANRSPGGPDCDGIAGRVAAFLRTAKWPVAVGLCVLFAALTSVRDWRAAAAAARIDAEGVTVPGRIFEGTRVTGRSSRGTSFLVAYTTADGQAIDRTFEVRGHFFNEFTDDADERLVADRVEVRYLPSAPREAYVVGGAIRTPLPFLVFLNVAMGVVIGALFLYFATMFVNHRTRIEARRQRRPPSAEDG